MWWLWIVAALAGDVLVEADERVTVEVDGERVHYDFRRKQALAKGVEAGERVVEVRRPGTRDRARTRVVVPDEGTVTLKWSRGALELVQPAKEERHRDRRRRDGDTGTPEGPRVGSILIGGLGPRAARVWVAGRGVDYAPGEEGFAVPELTPGVAHVRVEEHGRVRFDGEIEIKAGWTHRCVPQMRGQRWEMDCHWVEGVVEVEQPVIHRPPPRPRPVRPERPEPVPVPVAPPPPEPMVASAFQSLVRSVQDAGFSSDKLSVVQTAASHHFVTIAQVGALMDEMGHSSDKVKVVEILLDRVVDPENAHQLNSHLSFSSDRQTVQAMFQ